MTPFVVCCITGERERTQLRTLECFALDIKNTLQCAARYKENRREQSRFLQIVGFAQTYNIPFKTAHKTLLTITDL